MNFLIVKTMYISNLLYALATPWGKCPVLEVDGEPVTQHIAICRYLGRLAGLNGQNEWEDLRIDEIISVIDDLRCGKR